MQASAAEVPIARDVDGTEAEFGNLMFAVADLARHLGVDPEAAIRRTNTKLECRFAAVEAALAQQGHSPVQADLGEMEALWRAAKQAD